MINPEEYRDNAKTCFENLSTRGVSESEFNALLKSDQLWREALQELEALKQERKSKTPKGKPSENERKQLKDLSAHIQEKESLVLSLEEKKQNLALSLPNLTHPLTPIGQNDKENVILKTVGNPKVFDFPPKDHLSLLESLKGCHSKASSYISGARFSILSGPFAKLERALIQFMLDKHTAKGGYQEISAPVLVKSHTLRGTGQLPKFEDDLYKIDGEDLYLSPTGEVQLTNLFAKSIIDENDLPIKVCLSSPCFRKEAGSYGKDLKGLIRNHQFQKVELVCLCSKEDAIKELETLRNCAASILDDLELPYRIMTLCSGDLGFASELTYDLEVWLPSQQQYREISSCSSFGNFQSRRTMIRYRKEGFMTYANTLNGSGLAVGRTLAAIIENGQNKKGEITLPKALVPYMNQETIKHE